MTPAADLQQKWNRAAPWYDLATALLETLLFRRIRKRLLASASGRVLEVAAGTGINQRYYPAGTRVLSADLSPAMLQRARRRGARVIAIMEAERLAFGPASFDTVVSTLGTCTFPDPVAALAEMRRVCRPGGRILLLEHGRSDRPRIAAFQDRHAAGHARRLGCWWNRDTLGMVRQAGLQLSSHHRKGFGMLHIIEAKV